MFFPSVQARLKTKVRLSSNITTLLTGHVRINSYFYRFKIKDSAMCVCGRGEQTVDHIIYGCIELDKESEELKKSACKSGDTWPVGKHELRSKYIKHLTMFAKIINLEKLQ